MLKVEGLNKYVAKVTALAYWPEYNKRMKSVPGARLRREERPGQRDLWYWQVPIQSLDALEAAFPDDEISIFYETPRWKLEGKAPPPLPTYLTNVTPRQPKNFKLPLFPYQSYGAAFLVDAAEENMRERGRGYAFLCDVMGLGKSPQSLGAIELLIEDGKISPNPGQDMILILGLSIAKIQWIRDTVNKFTDHPGLAIKTQTPKARVKAWQTWPGYKYISANYDLLLQPDDLKAMLSIPWKAIILDEPHQKLMGWDGKMHQAVRLLIQEQDIPYVFILSGTPVMAHPEDLASLHDLVDPERFGDQRTFNKHHVIWSWQGSFAKPVAYKNINALRKETERYILRRTEQEVEVERPEGDPVNLDVEMTPLQKKLEEMIAERRKEISANMQEVMRRARGDENARIHWKGWTERAGDILENLDGAMKGTLAARTAIAIDPLWLLDSESQWVQEKLVPVVQKHANASGEVKAPKIDLLMEELKQRVEVEGEKVVIFLTSLKGARRLYRKLRCEFGRDALAYFVGGMSDDTRQAQIDCFMNNPSCKIMLANDAAKSAVNLQAAKYMYHLDLPWNKTDYEQRNGRIQRVGSQHKRVYIFNLVMAGSIDEDVLTAWERKTLVSESLLGVRQEQSQALQAAMSF